MRHFLCVEVGVLSIFLGIFSVSCSGPTETGLDRAIEQSRAALAAENTSTLVAFSQMGLDGETLFQVVPAFDMTEVQLYGETTSRLFVAAGLERPAGALHVRIDEVAAGDRPVDEVESDDDLARALVALGRSDQPEPLLDQPLVRASYLSLGQSVAHLVCLSNLRMSQDVTNLDESLYPVRCDLLRDLGFVSEAFVVQSSALHGIEGLLTAQSAALTAYLSAVQHVLELSTPEPGTQAPAYRRNLQDAAMMIRQTDTGRQTPKTDFGSMVRQGVATGAGAAAGAAKSVAPATEPQGERSLGKQALLEAVLAIADAQADVDAAMSGLYDLMLLPPAQLLALSTAVSAAVEAIDVEGSSGTELEAAATAMKKAHEVFVVQNEALESMKIKESRQYSTVSNVLKTKHDTVKNSISNVR